MPTQTKPKINPALEDGAVLLAEEVLSPSEKRLELAEALEKAWQPYQATRDRIDKAIKRQEDIAEELRAVPDEAARKRLTAERTALTGELVHAAADIEAVTDPYADALGQWANLAFQHGTSEYRRVAKEIHPLRVERMKVQERLQEVREALGTRDNELAKRDDRPPNWGSPCTFENDQGETQNAPEAQDLFNEIEVQRKAHQAASDSITALIEELERYESVVSAVNKSVRKFGDRAYDGGLFETAGQRAWVRRVRAQVSQRTTGITGFSDVLKPVAF